MHACSSEDYIIPNALPGLIHAVCVVGKNIWCCTGDGKVVIYSADTAELKQKVGSCSSVCWLCRHHSARVREAPCKHTQRCDAATSGGQRREQRTHMHVHYAEGDEPLAAALQGCTARWHAGRTRGACCIAAADESAWCPCAWLAPAPAQAFAAHQGEVLCIAAGPGGKYAITGGVDFNVRAPCGSMQYHAASNRPGR